MKKISRNLPELTIQELKLLDLSNYDWIHLEARKNVDDIREFIRRVRSEDLGRKITISVEIEKPFESRTVFLQDDVDYFFVSKDYARMKGANDLKEGIELITDLVATGNLNENDNNDRNIIMAWGESGAATCTVSGKNSKSEIIYSPAFAPKTGVIDTTGAGDAFIAAVIFARQLLQLDMKGSIGFGCKFAGAKCGVMGNIGLLHFDTLI